MTLALPLAIAPALLLMGAASAPTAPLSENPAMPSAEAARALTLDVAANEGVLEVRLTGLSPEARAVSYALEVKGRSTSRHRGSTTLAAGVPAVLSTLRADAGEDWCVTLSAEEAGSAPYAITRGNCAAQ